MDAFKMHEVVWEATKVQRFWNGISERTISDQKYFTAQVGDTLVELARRQGLLCGRICDYGAGRGHLTAQLLQQPEVNVGSVEYAPDAEAVFRERFGQNPRYLGCSILQGGRTGFPDHHFDLLYLIETVEHLPDEQLDLTLNEIRRLLRPGGVLLMTTPNAENLESESVLCPDCGCVFHPHQHVRSFTADSLVQAMESRGWQTRRCEATNLLNFRRRRLKSAIRFQLVTWLGSVPLDRIIYLGSP